MKLSRTRILSVLPLAIVFIYTAVMSSLALWMGDDITYMYSFKTGDEIRTLWDVVLSQAAHYLGNNGRTVAHFLVQLFLVFVGKTGFALVNAIVNVLFICLVLRISGKDLSDWKSVALVSGLSLLVFRTKFVPSCQIGYIWMFCLVLTFLIILMEYGKDNRPGCNWFWLAPFCLIAGWSQEALVIGVGAALAIYAAGHLKSLSRSQWMMIICFGAGGLLLCLSPATLNRTAEVHSTVDFLSPAAMSLAKFLLYIRATYVLAAVVLWRVLKNKEKIKDIYLANSFLWNAWIVLIAFNLVVGVFGNRQLFGFELISVILSVKLISEEKIKIVLSVFMLAAVAVLSICNTRSLVRERQIYDKVVADALSSEDGIVYYDFSASDVSFWETNPSDPFSWYALETIDRLLHTRGMDEVKKLRILPSYCREACEEGSVRVAEGALAIAIVKEYEPSSVLVKREFNFCGIKIPFKDMSLRMENPIFENESVRVYQLFEKVPCLKYTDVVFVR